MKTIRILDISFSLFGLLLLFPLFVCIAVLIKLTSKGTVFYSQNRVGKNGRLFCLYKFRTMQENAERKSSLTIGVNDTRITWIGYYLRKFKLDELPQLVNVFTGEMSLVGPRPEVPKYVALYTSEQRKVLSVRPGITDLASIIYRNENDLLASASDPEAFYVKQIMPEKIRLNFLFINEQTIKAYFKIIFKTIYTSLKGK